MCECYVFNNISVGGFGGGSVGWVPPPNPHTSEKIYPKENNIINWTVLVCVCVETRSPFYSHTVLFHFYCDVFYKPTYICI